MSKWSCATVGLFSHFGKALLSLWNGGRGFKVLKRRGEARPGVSEERLQTCRLQWSRPSCRGNKELAAVHGAEINRYLFERKMKGAWPWCPDNDAAGRMARLAARLSIRCTHTMCLLSIPNALIAEKCAEYAQRTDLRIEVLMGSGGYWKMYNAILKCSLWSAYRACVWDLMHFFYGGRGTLLQQHTFIFLVWLSHSSVFLPGYLPHAGLWKRDGEEQSPPNLFFDQQPESQCGFKTFLIRILQMMDSAALGRAHVVNLLSVSDHPSLLVPQMWRRALTGRRQITVRLNFIPSSCGLIGIQRMPSYIFWLFHG